MDSDQPPSWHKLLPGCALCEVAPNAPAPLHHPRAAIAKALEESGFVEFARSAASEGRSLTLVVNDTHRFTDTRSFLGAVLDLLDRFLEGERRPPLRVLVAHLLGMNLGTYRRLLIDPASITRARITPSSTRLLTLNWTPAGTPSTARS